MKSRLAADRTERKPAARSPRGFAAALLDAAAAPALRKVERTRLRILAAIAQLLADGAEPAELRVADIVAAADLAHGTFYRYFPDQRAAVEALVGDFARFLRDELANARDGATGSRARVRSATLAYTRAFRANAGLMRCLIRLGREDAAFGRAFQELNQAWNRRMAGAIARHRAGRSAKAASAESLLPTAYALGGMIDEFLTQLYLRRDPALKHLARDEEAVADLLTELWCLGAYGRLPPTIA
ncbi:MAG: TetR family transcriptional regulator [Rhodospirillaceae bacterium]|jgi:AcrR family transcriptional regulator|nr:TetR family transcriptional regulator [Rhodospirillaceae bacterium]